MMMLLMMAWLYFEGWLGRRRLRAHIRAVCQPQIDMAEQFIQLQREQFEQHRSRH